MNQFNTGILLYFNLKATPGFEPGDKGFADLKGISKKLETTSLQK
ncbi:MAG: hypothetical protein V7K47_07130 [Nostoc sp.]